MSRIIVHEELVDLARRWEIVQLSQQIALLQARTEHQVVMGVITYQLLEQLVGFLQLPVQTLALEQQRGLVKRERRVFALPVFHGVDEIDQHALRTGEIALLRQVAGLHEIGILRRLGGVIVRAQLVQHGKTLRVAAQGKERLRFQQLPVARHVGAQVGLELARLAQRS